MKTPVTVIEKLKDLHKQATKERSHYYVGSVAVEAAGEIIRLRKELDKCRRTAEGLLFDRLVFIDPKPIYKKPKKQRP